MYPSSILSHLLRQQRHFPARACSSQKLDMNSQHICRGWTWMRPTLKDGARCLPARGPLHRLREPREPESIGIAATGRVSGHDREQGSPTDRPALTIHAPLAMGRTESFPRRPSSSPSSSHHRRTRRFPCNRYPPRRTTQRRT